VVQAAGRKAIAHHPYIRNRPGSLTASYLKGNLAGRRVQEKLAFVEVARVKGKLKDSIATIWMGEALCRKEESIFREMDDL